jgi:hypothetical protein
MRNAMKPGIIVGGAIVVGLIWVTLVTGIIYVALHFILKFW